MAGVPGVGLCPPGSAIPCEMFGLFWAVPARCTPRRYLVREVAGVSAVVECKLFDRVVADAEVCDLLGEVPLSATALAGYRRRVGEVVGRVVVGHEYEYSLWLFQLRRRPHLDRLHEQSADDGQQQQAGQ